jgi:hypothetical protein
MKHSIKRLHMGRIRNVVAMAIALAVLTSLLVIARDPAAVGADSAQVSVASTCSTPFGPSTQNIPTTIADNPDPVVAGQQMTVSFTTDYPVSVTNAFTINSVTQTWPMPAQVVSVDSVTFAGGHANFVNTWTNPSDDDEVEVSFVATPPTQNRPPTPTVNVVVTIDAAAGGQTIDWLPYTTQTSNSTVPLIGTINSTCTPNATIPVINQTTVEAPATTTTTEATTTTTSSTTTTTAAPTEHTCTQTSNADGWTKNTIFGPGGLFSYSNGTSNQMYTTYDGIGYFRSFLKFAGAGGACAEGGTMPADVPVTDAELRVVKTKTCICFGWAQELFRVTESWSETNLQPNPGPDVAGTESAEFATPGFNSAATVSSAGITSDVQDWIDGDTANQGWSIRQRLTWGDTGNTIDPAGWATREHSTSSYRPTLTITYVQ